MKVYSNMPTLEFVMWLRDAAIAQKASALVIDQIDLLRGQDEIDEECEKISNELYDTESRASHYKEELEALLDACVEFRDPDEALLNAIKRAKNALDQ